MIVEGKYIKKENIMDTLELINKLNEIRQKTEELRENKNKLLKKVEAELVKDGVLKELTSEEEKYFDKYFTTYFEEDVPF